MKNIDDQDARTLDVLTHEMGLLEMQDGQSTEDDLRWAQDVAASMQQKIAEYRRSQLPATVPIKKAAPISQRLLEMSRSALDALFASLVAALGPKAQFAYRQLDTLSDNDLRRLIQRIETHGKRG